MSESLQNLSGLLEQLQMNHGLQLAAVVGMDGLVVDSASDGNVDAEMLAAVAAPGLLMMSELARELNEDIAQLTTMEYAQHVVVLLPLNDDSLLVAVAEAGSMNLGQLRIVLRRSTDAFRTALDRIYDS
jgi:predicted regulator of Ras-like GTPase activity (Roadblock/LC7/MglB family)